MDVAKVYRILHKVCEKGFDTVGVSFGGTSVVLKTISPHELDMVRYHSSGRGLESFRLYRLAYSTFMLDGVMVLGDRVEAVQQLIEIYKAIPELVFEKLEEAALRLQNRYRRYCGFIEGYSYSHMSRTLWRTRQGSPLLSSEVTGIQGSSFVGVPESVEIWALINMGVDREIENDRTMASALFVSSATNPKGAQKVGSSMDKEKELTGQKRKILIEYGNEANRKRVHNEEGPKKERWTAELDTTAAIIDELERQMRGEQDKHDLFIVQYRDKLRGELKVREEAEAARLAEVRRKRGGDPHTGSFAVSEEDMQRMLRGEVTSVELSKQKAEEDLEITAKLVAREGATQVVGKRVLGTRRGR